MEPFVEHEVTKLRDFNTIKKITMAYAHFPDPLFFYDITGIVVYDKTHALDDGARETSK